MIAVSFPPPSGARAPAYDDGAPSGATGEGWEGDRSRPPSDSAPPASAPALPSPSGGGLGEGLERGTAVAPLPAWFVAFVETPAPVWWQRLLKPGFRHCLAFAWDVQAQRWIVLNPLFDAVFLRALDDQAFAPFLANLRARRARILLARAETAAIRRPRLLLSCSSAVAALLGLDGACALSPRALYRRLRSRGAIEILKGA